MGMLRGVSSGGDGVDSVAVGGSIGGGVDASFANTSDHEHHELAAAGGESESSLTQQRETKTTTTKVEKEEDLVKEKEGVEMATADDDEEEEEEGGKEDTKDLKLLEDSKSLKSSSSVVEANVTSLSSSLKEGKEEVEEEVATEIKKLEQESKLEKTPKLEVGGSGGSDTGVDEEDNAKPPKLSSSAAVKASQQDTSTIAHNGYVIDEDEDAASASLLRKEEGGGEKAAATGRDADADDDDFDSKRTKDGVESVPVVVDEKEKKIERASELVNTKKNEIPMVADTSNSTSTLEEKENILEEVEDDGAAVEQEKIAKVTLKKDKSPSSLVVNDPPLVVDAVGDKSMGEMPPPTRSSSSGGGSSILQDDVSSKTLVGGSSSANNPAAADDDDAAAASSSTRKDDTHSFDNPFCKDEPANIVCKQIQERLMEVGGGGKVKSGVSCEDELFVVDITTPTTAVDANSTSAVHTTSAANTTATSSASVADRGFSADAGAYSTPPDDTASAAAVDARTDKDVEYDDEDDRRRRYLKSTKTSTKTIELPHEEEADNNITIASPPSDKNSSSIIIADSNNATIVTVPSDGNKLVITIGSRYCPETCNAVRECERARDYFAVFTKEGGTAIDSAATSSETSKLINGYSIDKDEEREDKNDDDDRVDEDDAATEDEDVQEGEVAKEAGDGEEIISDGKIAGAPCETDNPTFLYKDKAGYNCEYIAKNSPDICSKLHDGMMVGVAYCPVACKMVKECEEVQESDGNEVVNNVESDKMEEDESRFGLNATDAGAEDADEDEEEGGLSDGLGDVTAAGVLCEDDPSFLYKNKTGFTCEFIAQYNPDKCFKLVDGEKVGIVSCPVSCSMVAECKAMHNDTSLVDLTTDIEDSDLGKDMDVAVFGGTDGGSSPDLVKSSDNPTKSVGTPYSDNVVEPLVKESEESAIGNHSVDSDIDAGLIADMNATSSITACKDDPSFLYKDNAGYTCQFIGKMYPEKCSKTYNGKTIGVSSCPESCKMVDECLENAGMAVDKTTATYEADDVPNPSKEQVSSAGEHVKNISVGNTTVDQADGFLSGEQFAGTKEDNAVGVGTKSMVDEIEKDDYSFSNKGKLNGKTNQQGNDDDATPTDTKSMTDELDNGDFGSVNVGNLGGPQDFEDTSYEAQSSVVGSGSGVGDIDNGDYSQTTEAALEYDEKENNAKESELSTIEEWGAKNLPLPPTNEKGGDSNKIESESDQKVINLMSISIRFTRIVLI